MERWIRPLAALIVLGITAASCSLGEGGTAPDTTVATTEATTTTTLAATTVPPTTTTLPVVPQGQAGTFFVTDYGAMADGKNDDSEAFQAAVDAAAIDGGVVVVPSVSGQRAYVLNRTVEVPTGVSVVGAIAGVDVGGPYPWPDVDLTGVKILARPSPQIQPMFRLASGTNVEGLWITYDQQPLPSDNELQDEDLAYGYRSFEEVQDFFVDEHVTPMGPVFYIDDGAQVRIRNIVADRFYEFLYMKQGGPMTVDGVSLYGYGKGFTVEASDARSVFTNIVFGPRVGPFVPGSEPGTEARTWVFGAIASYRDNVGFHFGDVEAFVLDNVSFEAGNTAIRLGASFDHPIIDPVTEQFVTSFPARGPWGQIEDLRIEQAAVGLHLVWPSPVPTQISNVSMSTGIDDGETFPAVSGSGTLSGVSRQAFVLVEPSFSLENNGLGGQVPVIQAVNVSVDGSASVELFGEAAASVDVTNGRVFLIDGDLGMDINGFSLGLPYDDSFIIAVGGAAGEAIVRMRGVLSRGRPESDKIADRDGVEVLSGDVVVVEVPVTVPVPVTTTGAPDEDTTTTTPTTTAAP